MGPGRPTGGGSGAKKDIYRGITSSSSVEVAPIGATSTSRRALSDFRRPGSALLSKLLGPGRRRAAVAHLISKLGISERKACRLSHLLHHRRRSGGPLPPGGARSLVEHLVAFSDLSDHLLGCMALGLHVVVVLHFHSGGPDSHSGWTGSGGAPHTVLTTNLGIAKAHTFS